MSFYAEIAAKNIQAWCEEKLQPYVPPAAKIRLKFGQQQLPPPGPRVKINMGSNRSTPNPNGGILDSESLKRQREETGLALSRASRPGSRHTPMNGSTPAPAGLRQGGSVGDSSDHQNSALGTEDTRPTSNHSVPDPVRASMSVQNHISKSFPTPAMDGHPPLAANMVNGTAVPEMTYPQPNSRNLFIESDNPIDRKFRDPGKGKALQCNGGTCLTAFRVERRDTGKCDFPNTPETSQQPEVETESLRF